LSLHGFDLRLLLLRFVRRIHEFLFEFAQNGAELIGFGGPLRDVRCQIFDLGKQGVLGLSSLLLLNDESLLERFHARSLLFKFQIQLLDY
jgi:ATP phosphoribosyltransferase regulatory subunit HisZ